MADYTPPQKRPPVKMGLASSRAAAPAASGRALAP